MLKHQKKLKIKIDTSIVGNLRVRGFKPCLRSKLSKVSIELQGS